MPSVVIAGPLVVSERTREMSLPWVTPGVQTLPLPKVIRARNGLAQPAAEMVWEPLPLPATAVAMTWAGTLTI